MANLQGFPRDSGYIVHSGMLKLRQCSFLDMSKLVTPMVVGTLACISSENSGRTLGLLTAGMAFGRIVRVLGHYAKNSITGQEAALDAVTAIVQYTLGVAGGCGLLATGSIGLSIIMTSMTEMGLMVAQNSNSEDAVS